MAYSTGVARTRRTLILGASSGALALMLLAAHPAIAQTTDQGATATPVPPSDTTPETAANGNTTPASTNEPSTDSDIVVTGFRAALRSATAKKKNAETVVESVTSEDIGKLPDNGIGESIGRLPGLAAQRSNGRANIISIRGFGPDFSTTTLNGRQQTTTNDSRAVEFDQYPSEILAGVDVYKTSEADHPAGGLVGSIDLRTIRPLETTRRVLAIGARGTYVDQKLQPDSSDKGYRVYGTYVDKFMDGRLGVALSAAYSDEPYQTRDFNAWGFDTYSKGTGGLAADARAMSGFKSYFESDKLKRFGANATVQAQMSDEVVFTVDGFYSHFKDDINQRGLEMPLNFGAGNATVISATAENGLVTRATVAGKPVIENYATDRVSDQYAVGWNGRYDGEDGWHLLGDLSWSRTDRTDHNIETTAGLGYNLPGTTATVSYQLTDKGPQFTSNYNGASSALVLTDVEGWSSSPVQAGYDKNRNLKDDLVEARAEVVRDIGGFFKSIKVGADYVARTKTLNVREGFLSPPVGATSAAIPASLLRSPTTLDRGLGPIISYDPRGLVAAGVLRYVPNTSADVVNKSYRIGEDVWTPYAMLSLDGRFGAFKLTGNVGVQGIHTHVSSAASAFTPVTDNYWMVLPSANINLRSDSDFVIRIAASQQMMRPRLPDLNNNIGFGYNPQLGLYSGGGGNPFLRPYKADSIDFNLEKYFASKGYIALQTFYKHIDTYIANGIDTNFDYSGFPAPINQIVPPTPIGQFNGNVNTHGGHLYGAELAGTLPFDVFSPALTGFGVTGGGSYTKTQVKDFNGNNTVIPGYSKWVANATVFYDNHGFSARGSMRYRSDFLGDFAAFDGQPTRQQVYGETTFDAQIGYDFAGGSFLPGLSVYVQGQNLTDERTKARPGDLTNDLAVLRYQTYGRRIVAGATVKF